MVSKRAAACVAAFRPVMTHITDALDRCQYSSMQRLLDDVRISCKSAAEAACASAADMSEVAALDAALAEAEWLAETVKDVLLGVEAGLAAGKPVLGPVPESILVNADAYFQGDWRTVPYARRPYARLRDYQALRPPVCVKPCTCTLAHLFAASPA